MKQRPVRQPPNAEFITLVAMLLSLVAFATDSMLPAFPAIGADFDLGDINNAQMIIILFIAGTGVGQLIMGPLSDSFGRKPVILAGIMLFALASYWSYATDSYPELLLARFVQGIGVSAPRTVTHAMVRDRFSGRSMARILSLAMMLFVLVPAIAPLIGQTIMLAFGWRYIFVSFQLLAVGILIWLLLRQPETHPPDRRTPFRMKAMGHALAKVMTHRVVVTYTLSLSLALACIFSYLVSAQQAYVDWLDTGERFPLYFAIVAVVSGSASFLNARLVMRLGMWTLSTTGFLAISLMSIICAGVIAADLLAGSHLLWLFVAWSAGMFFLLGLCMANLNALALEPMGQIAGLAASVIGAVSTLICTLLAIPIGQLFNGTGIPLMLGVAVYAGLAFLANLSTRLSQSGQS